MEFDNNESMDYLDRYICPRRPHNGRSRELPAVSEGARKPPSKKRIREDESSVDESEVPRKKKGKAKLLRRDKVKRSCTVCGSEFEVTKSNAEPATSGCEHENNTCSDCTQQWIASQVEDGPGKTMKCPECAEVMEFSDIKRLAAREVFERYDTLLAKTAMGEEEEFMYCLNPKCKSGQIHPSGLDEPIFTCNSCDKRYCLVHRSKWHEDKTCAEMDEKLEKDRRKRRVRERQRRAEKASERYVAQQAKTCPNFKCGARIQKSSGCDHMTCSRCKHEFCYRCLGDYREILRDGNQKHLRECEWYRPIEAPTETPDVESDGDEE